MATAFTLKSIFEAIDRISGPVRTMAGNVDHSSKSMGRSFAKVGASSMRIGSLLKGAAVGLATGEIAKALGDFAEHGDEIARNAKILGIGTTAYQELTYAAKMADIPQEDLAAAMKKMNVNVGELRTKEGTLYTTLAKTNPKLAFQLRDAKSSEEAFNLLAGALGKETNVQKRAVLAVAAFGKAGQALIPMFDDLAAKRAEANAAGGVMTPEQVRQAEELDDTLKHIRSSFAGIKNNGLGVIAGQLAPELEKLSDWLKNNKDSISSDLKTIIDVFEGGIKTVSGFGSALKETWKMLSIPGDIIGGLASGDMGMVKGALGRFGSADKGMQKAGETVLRGTGLGSFVDAPKGWNDRLGMALGIKDRSAYAGMSFSGMPTSAADAMLAGMVDSYQSQAGAAAAAASAGVRASKMPPARVEIDFKNLPPGVDVRQTGGSSESVGLNTGKQMRGLGQ